MTIYIFTLDSHDYYGPFRNIALAHAFASRRNLTSYQIITSLPTFATLTRTNLND